MDWQKEVWEMAHEGRIEDKKEKGGKKGKMEKKGKGMKEKKEEDYENW